MLSKSSLYVFPIVRIRDKQSTCVMGHASNLCFVSVNLFHLSIANAFHFAVSSALNIGNARKKTDASSQVRGSNMCASATKLDTVSSPTEPSPASAYARRKYLMQDSDGPAAVRK